MGGLRGCVWLVVTRCEGMEDGWGKEGGGTGRVGAGRGELVGESAGG
jgi:hypothetical protein